MSKLAVVFWSGTGNTEAMANCIAEGAKGKGAEVDLIFAGDFTKDKVDNYDAFAFGCPSMGAEVLEETEFQPMWDDVKSAVNGKKIVLFGSYDWGDGEWMRIWEDELSSVIESYICHLTPDDAAQAKCRELGEKLA